MSVKIYRYGECRKLPGLSIGVARQAPRGVRREDRATRGYFDLWLPMLGPSRELLRAFRKGEISFATFSSRYRKEVKRPEPRQVISLLAIMSKNRRLNLGCFCADPERCHRSLLRDLVVAAVESAEDNTHTATERAAAYASPPCLLAEFSDELAH